jgi:hypothetical protein
LASTGLTSSFKLIGLFNRKPNATRIGDCADAAADFMKAGSWRRIEEIVGLPCRST